MALLRVRHSAFIVMTLSVLVFGTAFFSYYVGIGAGIAAMVGGIVAFHRAESVDLLLYGLHPCFGVVCSCGPATELHSTRLMLSVAAFLSGVSFVVAIVATFQNGAADWLVAMRICCATFSFLLAAAAVSTVVSLQYAMSVLNAWGTNYSSPARAPPTAALPYSRDPYELPHYDAAPHPVAFGSPYPATRSPRRVQTYPQPWSDPVYAEPTRYVPRYR